MPENTPAVQVRFARHTERLTEIVAFYRDGLGLPQVGSFTGHDGYDGVFLALPGTRAHLEFTSGGAHDAPGAHPETLLVLYLGTVETVRDALTRVGSRPVRAANPYWDGHGVTLLDPDGFRVVLVPEHWAWRHVIRRDAGTVPDRSPGSDPERRATHRRDAFRRVRH